MHSLNLLSGSSSFPVKLLLPRQGLSTDLGNAKNTLSSWDSCMSKAYCKVSHLSAKSRSTSTDIVLIVARDRRNHRRRSDNPLDPLLHRALLLLWP